MSKPANEINRPFTALLAIFNSVLEQMNECGYKIQDTDEPEYYIDKAIYNSEKDRIEPVWKEDNVHE
nr:MAG TPA: hypothetical protein [Caudoviricetes sp.]